MKIDRAVASLSGTRTNIYTATKDGEIVFSVIATCDRACNLYLYRSTGTTSAIEYSAKLTPYNAWKFPGKVTLRAGESFAAKVMEASAVDWHSLPDWDTNPDWDNPGESTPSGAIAAIDLSVIQL